MAFGLFILQSYPQNNLCPQWEVISDGDDWDVVSDMKKDARGNIYVTGNFTASTGFGPNTDKLTGDNSAFVAKFTGDGENIWMRKISSTGFCHTTSICCTGAGQVYISGNFNGEMELGGQTLKSENFKSTFVAGLNNDGDITWANLLQGVTANEKLFLTTGIDDNLVLGASFTGDLKLHNTACNKSKHTIGIVVAKFGAGGDIVATKALNGSGDCIINNMAVNNKNEVLITGSFAKSIDVNGLKVLSPYRCFPH